MTEQSTPTPTETDPLAALLESDALYEKDDGGSWSLNSLVAAAAIRAAGYLTEAEWETKRGRRGSPNCDSTIPEDGFQAKRSAWLSRQALAAGYGAAPVVTTERSKR